MNSSIFAACDKLCPLEYTQMLGNPGERDMERGSQVADGGFTQRQACQDAAPGNVGKCAEGSVKIEVGILNHMV